MSEQESDALEFSPSTVTETCASAAEIVGSDIRQSALDRSLLDHSLITFGLKPLGAIRPALLLGFRESRFDEPDGPISQIAD